MNILHTVRSLAKARAFTLVSVISLGIGMAPVIAIPYVSRVSKVPPAGVKTERMVELVTTAAGPAEPTDMWSYPDFRDLRDADMGMTLIATTGGGTEVRFDTSKNATETVHVMYVPANYFPLIGVSLAQGAGFDAAADDPINVQPVVILGYQFWQERLSADPAMVGKTLTIDGTPHVVVGIAPDQFVGHMGFQGAQMFLPLERHPALRAATSADTNPPPNLRANREQPLVHIMGQLRPGVSVAQASAAVAGVTARLAATYPSTNEFRAGIAAEYDPVGVLTRSGLRRIQALGFTLTGLVLLVVALNVSGMMQVRSAMRERELSIRQAIGASRARLARYLLSEAIVIACASGTLASLVLFNAPAVISQISGQPIPPAFQVALRVDPSIIAIVFALCLVTSLLFGWLPAMRFSRPVILSSLKDEAGGGGFRVGRVHRVTAALQVAIAVPLIVMSGQSIDRVRATATTPIGFDADLLYAAPLKLDGLTTEVAGFQERRLSAELTKAAGVASVTVADGLPLDFRYRLSKAALAVGPDVAPVFIPVHVTRVGDGYLNTLGIPLERGRGFGVDDRAGSEPVTIVSKPLAEKLAPGGDVIGKRLTFGANPKAQQTLTIVGVTADFPTSQMSTAREQLLVPLAQHPSVVQDAVGVDDDEGGPVAVLLIARSAPGEPAEKISTAVEHVVRELDPEFLPAGIVTGVGLRRHSVDDFLTQSAVAGVAGGVILLLAALGVYGVVGLMVATRTREIAVRAALGASRRRVLAMIVFDVVTLVSPGVAVGLVLTVILNRINAENMGVSLSHFEPLAYVGGAVVAVLVAVVASLAPARRAASVEPMVAMRSL